LFAEKIGGKLCYGLCVFLISNQRGTGRDTSERACTTTLAKPLFQAPQEHGHLNALSSTVLMRLV
jgi:hypothetical protein